jgi:hypothetical protein
MASLTSRLQDHPRYFLIVRNLLSSNQNFGSQEIGPGFIIAPLRQYAAGYSRLNDLDAMLSVILGDQNPRIGLEGWASLADCVAKTRKKKLDPNMDRADFFISGGHRSVPM